VSSALGHVVPTKNRLRQKDLFDVESALLFVDTEEKGLDLRLQWIALRQRCPLWIFTTHWSDEEEEEEEEEEKEANDEKEEEEKEDERALTAKDIK